MSDETIKLNRDVINRRNPMLDKIENLDKIGFKNYEYKGVPLEIRTPLQDAIIQTIEEQTRYSISPEVQRSLARQNLDTRSRFRKFINNWKRRLGHAWYAFGGGECD